MRQSRAICTATASGSPGCPRTWPTTTPRQTSVLAHGLGVHTMAPRTTRAACNDNSASGKICSQTVAIRQPSSMGRPTPGRSTSMRSGAQRSIDPPHLQAAWFGLRSGKGCQEDVTAFRGLRGRHRARPTLARPIPGRRGARAGQHAASRLRPGRRGVEVAAQSEVSCQAFELDIEGRASWARPFSS